MTEPAYGTCPACGARVVWVWDADALKALDPETLLRLPGSDGRLVETYLSHAPVCPAKGEAS